MMARCPNPGWLAKLALPCLAVLICLVPRYAAAQAVSGTILGEVKDSSGAVVPGATVTFVHVETGRSRTVVSDSKGEYSAPLLPTGNYTVSAEMSGFKKVSMSNVHLGVDQKLKLDLKLDLGQMTESVEIQAEAPLLQTSSSDLSTTIGAEQIRQLPLNGRNFVSLTRAIPGVARGIPGANIDGAGSLAWRASASFSANGQRARDNNYMLDGVDNNETWLQTVVIFPSVDAIDEFKMQTSTYTAEFGRSMGGVVNLQLRSGTNQFHGSAFDFYRNDAFDANNFFNNRAGVAKPDFKQNQFGATIGGPIIKDKTFFFADYQGFRVNQGQTRLSTVPSDAMRQGDFSQITRVIYDPLTGQPFPGNVIPADRIDPVAANILSQLYPTANAAGRKSTSNGQTLDNYLITPTLERQDNQFDVKIDHSVSQNNRIFARYSYQKTHRFLPPTLPHGDAGATFGAGDGNIKAQGLAVNDTHSFSPNLLNEFRFGWVSIDFLMTPIDFGTNPAAAVGIQGINTSPQNSAMTQLGFQNIRNLGANANQPLITNQNDFQVFDSLTKIRGRQTFKLGTSVTFRSREIYNNDTQVGNFQYNQNQTSNCAGKPVTTPACVFQSNTGFDVASFLLGYAASKVRNQVIGDTYTEKRPEFVLYLQDDYRVNSRLTLNLGLRWDVFKPWIEVDNRQANFDPSTGQFVPASDNAVIDGVTVGRTLQTYSKGDLGPRLGFAYDVSGNGSTLVRGGFGVFWNFMPGGTSSSKGQVPPFLQSQALSTTPNAFGINLTTGSGLPPAPPLNLNAPAAGANRSIFIRDFRDGYAMNWNVNVQHSLGRNYLVELAYVGSAGRQMVLKDNPNQPVPTVGQTNPNAIRPYVVQSPALRDILRSDSIGTLDYYGFFVKFQRRFSNGFSFLNAYTYSKAIDIASDNEAQILNNYDPGYDRALAAYDVRQTISSSWIYELPFAKNSGWGGWMLNGILYWRTGLPFNVTSSQGVISTATGNRPDIIGDPYAVDQTINTWFNPAAYHQTLDSTGTYGNVGRNTLEGPGQFNIDLSLSKTSKFGKAELELRVDAFNVLNHPQFSNPNGIIGNSAVGTITSMLSNPACALCGTTERNIQLSAKLRF